MARLFLCVYFCLLAFSLSAQELKPDSSARQHNERFHLAPLIIPASLLTFGFVGLESHTLQNLNSNTRAELSEHIDSRISIDDFSQYAPILAVYGINALGNKSQHSFADRNIILGTAYLIMGSTVNLFKRTTRVERPDHTSNNSFPSGHTATAFMGAEFLFREYKHKSVWYGISGYVVAAGTGFFRMSNNRHWLTDVAAGAGIGMLSTKVAYLVHPFLKKKIFKTKQKNDFVILPYATGKSAGIGLTMKL